MTYIQNEAKALIFDIDGTIADTMELHIQIVKDIFLEYGVQFQTEDLTKLAGMPIGKQFHIWKAQYNLGDDFDPEQLAIRKEVIYRDNIDQITPLQPVYDILIDHLDKMPIACGTGGDRLTATKTLETIGLADKIEVVITSDDVENGKPSPDTFLLAAEKLGVNPSVCQVFEDAEFGFQAAESAGMMYIDVADIINK